MKSSSSNDWLNLHRDNETGIESVHAHFRGHAYDPHDHNEMLVGVTHQGLQQFSCHRKLHTSSPGKVILIEPEVIHDGHAPTPEGFTYSMLYLPQAWLNEMLQRRNLGDASNLQSAFRATLTDDLQLNAAIQQAFAAIHHDEGRLARDQCLDRLLDLLARHIAPQPALPSNKDYVQMSRIKDYLHDCMHQDMGLDDIARYAGISRFRLTRQFQKFFGQSPHAYLVRLRLRTARLLLSQGNSPARVAAQVGFSDQSHLGRWFQRAYRITPMAYQQQCSNLLYRRPSLAENSFSN